jgi:hypothetical protein
VTVRTYECSIPEFITDEGPYSKTIMATSASKARYQCLLGLRDAGWSPKFQDIHVRSVSAVPIRILADFARVAVYRGLPFARIGMKVEVEGHSGVIVGKNDSANFDVCFTSGPRKGTTGNCHPKWMMKYFDYDGTVIAEYGG